jgi:CheY-like chemotaxis protein
MTALPRIFVVDDEADAREMVGEYLGMQGFEVTLCDGGASLRQKPNDKKPDLVVPDLNMPEEDGLSIVRYLKQTCPVPVIMLAATASAIDRVVGLEMGADDYLAKPWELRELLARIRSVLRRLKWAPAHKTERRLAAIVSLDFVGFGRYIQEKEADTLAALDRIFSEVITPSLTRSAALCSRCSATAGCLNSAASSTPSSRAFSSSNRSPITVSAARPDPHSRRDRDGRRGHPRYRPAR